MKIGIVCPYNLYRPGGVQMQVRAQLKELKQRGHDVTVIAPKPRKFEGEVEEDVILFGTSTELNGPFLTKADVSIHAGPTEIKAYLDEQQFDILHFHEPLVPMLPLQILNKSTSINVATFHAKMPDMRIYKAIGKAGKPFAKSIVRKLHGVVGVSTVSTDYVSTLLEDDQDINVEIIPNAIDLDEYDPDKVQPFPQYQDDIKTILYLNRIEKRKGPDLLMKAYRQLAADRDDVRLIMASDGDMRQDLEVYVAAYDIPNVEFVGFVNEEEKKQLYKSADLYCSPAPYGESFGVVLLEALAMQVPLIAGDNPGYSEVMGDRAKDYLVDPKLTSLLAKQLEEMLFNEDKRNEYKQWAATHVKQYSYASLGDAHEKMYKKLLAEK